MPGRWKRMTNFAFTLPHRPGALAEFVGHAKDAGIDFVGLWGYATGDDDPRFSCVPSDAETFRGFCREQGLDYEAGPTAYFDGADRRGALADALEAFAGKGINLDAIETVAAGGQFGCFIWSDDENWNRLEGLLES